MKKILTIVLLMILYVSCIDIQQVNAASNIYFAGLYQKIEEHEDCSDYYTLDMQQYSSPEGSKKGSFTLQEESDYRLNFYVEGQLKKIGKNKYRCKKGKVTLTFKVYKKKVVIKQKGESEFFYYDFSGTYQKIESYPLP